MRTTHPKPQAAKWYLVDAKGKTLGRLSTKIATVLHGKHKPSWSPHQLSSDHVVVLNAKEIVLSGNKAEKKSYFSHSGYFGHGKRTPFTRVFAKDPAKVVLHAVKKMLPRNKLREGMMKHLHIFEGAEHEHDAQQPEDFSILFPERKDG